MNGTFIQETPLGSDQCIGKYEPELSALFVDCYDKNGVIESKEEFYYQDRIEKECGTWLYKDLKSHLDGWRVTENYTDNTVMPSCDYFEWGNGYLFSDFNSTIGTIIIPTKRNGDRSKFFESLKPIDQLTWDWSQL
jgi:hypothetical protein